MATRDMPVRRANPFIRMMNPVTRRVLGAGLPMGPNVLLTVRGRRSGEPRVAPVALAEVDGRRFIVGTFGEVNWVRNLRAAGEATIRLDGRIVPVRAVELDPAAATAFFSRMLGPFLGGLALPFRFGTRILLRLAAPEMFSDPVAAALTRPVFELTVPDAAEPG